MGLKIGQTLIRVRDARKFVVEGATSYSHDAYDAIQTYRLVSTGDRREEVFTDDVQLEFERSGFRMAAESS